MYASHWGLQESPFRNSLDPKYFHSSPTHEEALARLHFLVEHGRRAGLLLGSGGSGKSLLLKVFAEQLQRQGLHTASVNLLGLDPREFLWELAAQLRLNPRIKDDRFVLWRRIADRLTENHYQQLGVVALLDDAHEASSDVLAHVVRLLQSGPAPAAQLTVVLASNPRRLAQLGQRLLDLAGLRIEIELWDAEDTSDYLRSSILKAGREAPVFEPPAANRLHQLTGGVPRQISQLAELTLLAGAGEQLERIDRDTIESVYSELSVGNSI
jgi:type II secretory pathway predicted ATPase ExeA